MGGKRKSVCADAAGDYDDFEPNVIEKSDTVRYAIMDKIENSFMF